MHLDCSSRHSQSQESLCCFASGEESLTRWIPGKSSALWEMGFGLGELLWTLLALGFMVCWWQSID